MNHPYQGYLQAMARLQAVLDRAFASALERPQTIEEFEQHEDRKEIQCERCAEWPCVCGEPEFESWVTAELNKAEAEGRD